MFSFFVLLVLCSTLGVPCQCFFHWFLGTPAPRSVPVVEDPKDFNKDGTGVVVPFEMKTSDEDFINEGKKYGLQLSKLDVCHHKVFLNLKASCSSMSEEDMGKLSVRLLNCQSSVEGRPTFPCTDDMSLRECTKNMDQHTWNTYHLVGNRARAVCYSTRQQQFHAKTEMTVNKLMWSSEQQVKAMSQLEIGQAKVSSMTSQTLEAMSSGQRELMAQQEKLKTSQQSVQSFVAENLRELTHEKALIAAGQRELARMTDNIRKKLDATSGMMRTNEKQRQVSHSELLKDLSAVHEYAKFLRDKLDTSAKDVVMHHKEASIQFHATLDNLSKINSSIAYLQRMMEETRSDLDRKFGWMAHYLYDHGDQLSAVYCCILHSSYMLVAMFLAGFMNVSLASRSFLLIVVPMNAVSEIKEGSSLSFGALTMLLLIFVLGDSMRCAFKYRRYNQLSASTGGARTQEMQANARCSSCSIRPVQHNNSTSLADVSMSIPVAEPDDSGAVAQNNRSQRWRSSSTPRSSTPSRKPQRSPSVGMSNDDSDDISNVSLWSLEPPERAAGPTAVPNSSMPAFAESTVSPVIGSAVRRDLLSYLDTPLANGRFSSPARSSRSNRSNGSNSSRRMCSGLNKSGAPCKGTCVKGLEFCHHHRT